ncbi:hypothetical protein BDV98DRAFT_596190 [Pterulicium gracile]|uniref:Peptide hydrolase n=1 Tax=Pterulicium gracile TaxID=1884261 RepID=A0A5C3Q760_9AGAR|nr:hypothetical protein BDV98DRAFT_596190 [Pterula gracilis]
MKLYQILALVAFFNGAAALPALSEFKLKASQGLRLLELGEGLEPVWKTEAEKTALMEKSINFFDLTETYELEQSLGPAAAIESNSLVAAYPAPSKQSTVTPLLSRLSTSQQTTWLNQLTSYNNRYYTASTGATAATWIQTTIRNLASAAGRSDVTVRAFTHSWAQSSTIVTFASTGTGPVTVLGGHMDSIAGGSASRAPGADDDGTGTVNLMDAARVLIQSGFKPATPLEFHFYAGEEAGLLGSNAIATNYRSAGKTVKGMLQLDMTAYVKPGTTETIGLITDNTNADLNAFIRQLATSYSRIRTTNSACGYGCSDHASWTRNGFPSAFPFEATFANSNPNIHTSGDTTAVSGFSWTHSLEFAKLAVAFAVELSSA